MPSPDVLLVGHILHDGDLETKRWTMRNSPASQPSTSAARYNSVPPDVYRAFAFAGAGDLGNMFQFKRDFELYFCGARSPGFTRRLNPGLQDFRTWVVRNRGAIPFD